MAPSNTSHRQNYIETLSTEIHTFAQNNTLSPANAAARVLLEWLDYEEEDLNFIDSRDRGIDAWSRVDDSIEIFQVKTHAANEALVFQTGRFDGTGVRDLNRAIQFLKYDTICDTEQRSLRKLLTEWQSIKYRWLQSSNDDDPVDDDPVMVGIRLILLGDGLTPSATKEFEALKNEFAGVDNSLNTPVQFIIDIHTINDVISHRWRQENREWKDRNGTRHESIRLTPSRKKADEGYISENNSAVMYCRGISLVNAYETLGYQLFEPNVRANIKKSQVNKAIRDSVANQRYRKEFRFLNNGVTIVCDSFQKPRGGSGRSADFVVSHPGIVNGLQTVVALHDAYNELEDNAKRDFEENCSVLVRLLHKQAVKDVTAVVRATNNQNPMQPRNLVSNNLEQIEYVKLFANRNWFYEAKQGAWDAFSNDAKRWRPVINKNKRDFLVRGGRSKAKRLDNERLAQIWLAFIGFADEASDRPSKLFDEKYYDLIFKQKTRKHGRFYDEDLAKARDEAINESPSPSLLLIAHFCWEFAREITPSAQQNRADAVRRLNNSTNELTKAQLDERLSRDDEYVLNQALNNMSLLYTEFVGYVLFRCFDEKLHQYGERIIENESFGELHRDYLFDAIKEKAVGENYGDKDLLIVLWFVFVDLIRDMAAQNWGAGYQAAQVKMRHIFSEETRSRLYKGFEDQNKFMKKRSMTRLWAAGIEERSDVCDFVQSTVLRSRSKI